MAIWPNFHGKERQPQRGQLKRFKKAKAPHPPPKKERERERGLLHFCTSTSEIRLRWKRGGTHVDQDKPSLP